jgi:hypothetical protein
VFAFGSFGRRICFVLVAAGDTDKPSAEEIWPDLERTEALLRAVARDDDDRIRRLRDDSADFWNVAWTLALLLRDTHNGDEAALALVEEFLGPSEKRPPAT